MNAENEKVSWKFVGLGELQELSPSKIQSGIEVLSTLSRGASPPRTLRKQALNAFWYKRNRDKTAGELLPQL